MKLAYTNEAFTYLGVRIPGVPVLMNDDMAILEGAQRWLFYIALDRGRTRSRATWRSYAEALFDWLQTCEVNGWDWDDVEEGQLRVFGLCSAPPSRACTNRPAAARTCGRWAPLMSDPAPEVVRA